MQDRWHRGLSFAALQEIKVHQWSEEAPIPH